MPDTDVHPDSDVCVPKKYTCVQCGEEKPRRAFARLFPDPKNQHRQRCTQCVVEFGNIKEVERDEEGIAIRVVYKKFDQEVEQYLVQKREKQLEADVKRSQREAEKREAEKLKTVDVDAEAARIAEQREARNKRLRAAREKGAARARAKHRGKIQEALAQKRIAELEKAKESAAGRELASRELARRRLIPFIQRAQPDYMAGWVHMDIAYRLEKFSREVAEKKSPRLMLQMPPRLGKTLEASVMFPAWHLGHYPNHEIITCTYAGSLANGISRKVRGLVDSEDYGVLFPGCRVDPENRNAEGWLTKRSGGFVPAGVGGAITGKGAHVLIVDDPVKNAEEAESPTVREATYDWYTSTAYTRLAPGGGVLVIQTRWHLDDLSGRLEEKMLEGEGDEFEIVRYPAIAIVDEDYRRLGEALHPDRYDERAYARIRRAVGPRVWSALYQQNPVEDEGGYFDIEQMVVRYAPDERPEYLAYFSAWDLAITKKDRSDFTVGLIFGVDKDRNIWIVDMIRRRMDGDEIVEAILDAHELWNTEFDGIEKGHIQQAIGPFLEMRAEERGLTGHEALPLPTGRQDKEARARPIQGLLKQNRVRFPEHAAWMEVLVTEMDQFPYNKGHDDCVDALAWVGQMLREMDVPSLVENKGRVKGRRSWKDKLNKYITRGTRPRSPMAA